MSNKNFYSTSFYLSKWSSVSKSIKKPSRPNPIELDITNSKDTRKVCEGTQCTLFYDKSINTYQPLGSCQRSIFCTETRIIKDTLYVKQGEVSNTLDSINYENQLLNWKL